MFEDSFDRLHWVEIPGAHGDDATENHVENWVEAINILPPQIDIDVVMHSPGRNYRALKSLTAPLRQRNVRVRANLFARDGYKSQTRNCILDSLSLPSKAPGQLQDGLAVEGYGESSKHALRVRVPRFPRLNV